MSLETVILKKQDHIGTIILSRPERLNAMNQQLFDDLELALDEVAKDPEIRALVVTGAGRAFCAGGDFRPQEVRTGAVATEEAEPVSYDSILRARVLTSGPGGVFMKLRG